MLKLCFRDMEDIDIKDFLLYAMEQYEIKVERHDDHHLYLEKQYAIEIEGPQLFKLMHQGSVVAPFDDVEEMCIFISQDMKLQS